MLRITTYLNFQKVGLKIPVWAAYAPQAHKILSPGTHFQKLVKIRERAPGSAFRGMSRRRAVFCV
jgi:hypothetical protein